MSGFFSRLKLDPARAPGDLVRRLALGLEARRASAAARHQRARIESAQRKLDEEGVLPLLKGLSPEALPPHCDDLLSLYELILSTRPTLALEYGSGCSTVVIASAMRRIARETGRCGRLISIESNDKWRDHTWALMSQDLREIVELRFALPETRPTLADIQLRNYQTAWYPGDSRPMRLGVFTLIYPELHELSPDFIYLDGPAPGDAAGYADADGKAFPAVVSDPLFMEPRLAPGTVLAIDGRQPNCVLLHANLKRSWAVERNSAQNFTVLRLEN